jgi:hypothetical protein
MSEYVFTFTYILAILLFVFPSPRTYIIWGGGGICSVWNEEKDEQTIAKYAFALPNRKSEEHMTYRIRVTGYVDPQLNS